MIRLLIAALLLAAPAWSAPVMVVDSGYAPEYWLPLDAEGWTDIAPSVDSRQIYVSSSEGSDENDGLSAETPKASLAAGKQLMRTGYPDWMYLKAGDTWAESGGFGVGSGRSPSEPSVITTYGTGARPQILATNIGWGDNQFVVWRGIEWVPNGTASRVWVYGGCDYWLIEDCAFSNGSWLAIEGGSQSERHSYVTVRRTHVYKSWNLGTGSHTQGIYCDYADNVLIEENVLDTCGWDPDQAGAADPDNYNHGIYIQDNNTGYTIRRNVIARSSSHGIQARSGGTIENNLLLRTPCGLLFGGGYMSVSQLGIAGDITNNVLMKAAHINNPQTTYPEARGYGIEIGNLEPTLSTRCAGNIVCDYDTDYTGDQAYGIRLATWWNDAINPGDDQFYDGVNNLTLTNNVVHSWRTPFSLVDGYDGYNISNVAISNNVFSAGGGYVLKQYLYFADDITWSGNTLYTADTFGLVDSAEVSSATWAANSTESSTVYTAPSFTDSSRTIESYMASLGYAESDQTMEKFLELARANSKADWNTDFTADAVNDYIRAGFVEE